MPQIMDPPEVKTAQGRKYSAIRWGRPEEAAYWSAEVLRRRAANFRRLADDLDREAAGMAEQS